MEKISGIIKANTRTSKTDVSNSQPVRPGAPAFGRPMGKVTLASTYEIQDKFSVSDEARKQLAGDKVSIATEMADKFSL
ncbi:MAG: hypothetical protein V4736_03195, partial [Bdellovibrionota bacterium]